MKDPKESFRMLEIVEGSWRDPRNPSEYHKMAKGDERSQRIPRNSRNIF